MKIEMIFAIVGMFALAVVAMWGKRQPIRSVDEWAVAGRKYGIITTWILQAGETFTTFTFLGTVGIVIAAGGSANYVIPYIPLAYLLQYWIAPKLWRRARDKGYVSQSEFLAGTYRSQSLGTLAAVCGIMFLIPYLQLQITGLGLIIQAATGGEVSPTLSTIIGFGLVIAFVIWSGLRGIAKVSYVKDVLMIVIMIVLMIAIPMHFNGGLFENISKVAREMPEMLYAPPGAYGPWWVITSMAVSMIGVIFYALPHMWPAILASRSERVVRRNLIYLPIYSGLASIPMLLGFIAIVHYSADSDADAAMLQMAAESLPSWLMGLVIITAATTAMVPSAALLLSMGPMVASNIFRARGEKQKMFINQATVLVIGGGALILSLTTPNLLANMLLLTFSGSTQVVPAIAGALLLKKPLHRISMMSGLVVGVIIVIFLTFGPYTSPINEGIEALLFNLLVVAVVELVIRRRRKQAAVKAPAQAVPASQN